MDRSTIPEPRRFLSGGNPMDEKELYAGEMDPPRIRKLLERWGAPGNEYAVGAEPLSVRTWHLNQVVLGPECRSLVELERVVAKIRADLDALLAEAKAKIARQ
jgi:hypothetical protein